MNENEIKRKFNIISEEVKPKPRIVRNCFRAFWVGGLICLIGQIIFNFLSLIHIEIIFSYGGTKKIEIKNILQILKKVMK